MSYAILVQMVVTGAASALPEQHLTLEGDGYIERSRNHPYDIKSKDLVRFVFQTCGWEKKLTYRVPGVRLAPDSHKVYFDLRQALEVHEGRVRETSR